MSVVLLLGCFGARQSLDWVRIDGEPVESVQLQEDHAACTRAAGVGDPGWDERLPGSRPDSGETVVDSIETVGTVATFQRALQACMRDRGYVPRS